MEIPPCLTGMIEHAIDVPEGAAMSLAVIPKGCPWPKSTLTVAFVDPEPFPGVRSWISRIANQWTLDTGVHFVWNRDSTKADIRIGHRHVGAYWSLLGSGARHVAPPEPTMMLGFHPSNKRWHWDDPTERSRLILHEFGHALGLDHEHKHPDANLDVEAAVNWYAPYFPDLSRDEVREQFARMRRREIDSRSTPFDISSVMLYSFPVEVWPPDGVEARSAISERDRAAVRSLYGPA